MARGQETTRSGGWRKGCSRIGHGEGASTTVTLVVSTIDGVLGSTVSDPVTAARVGADYTALNGHQLEFNSDLQLAKRASIDHPDTPPTHRSPDCSSYPPVSTIRP